MLDGLFSKGNWPRPPPRLGVPRYVPTPDIEVLVECKVKDDLGRVGTVPRVYTTSDDRVNVGVPTLLSGRPGSTKNKQCQGFGSRETFSVLDAQSQNGETSLSQFPESLLSTSTSRHCAKDFCKAPEVSSPTQIAIMVKKRASKSVQHRPQVDFVSRTNIFIAAVTRKAEDTSSPSDAPIARDVHQRTRQSRDLPSETWLSRPPFVRTNSSPQPQGEGLS